MKKHLASLALAGAALLALAVHSHAQTVSLVINQSGFENGSGTPSAGMSYGLLVDTGGNGFLSGSYIPFTISTNGQFLSTLSGVTDDYFVFGGTLGVGQTPPQTATPIPALAGNIGTVSSVSLTAPLATNQAFAVIWFPGNSAATVGDLYGVATDTGGTANMLIPPQGNASVAPTSVSTKTPTFAVVPEPSSALLLALAGMAMSLRCRHRS